MKTLTIKEPYATLIKEKIKKYEFRTWKTNYRGEILIHAGKSIVKEETKKYNYEYKSGKIIAIAKIEDCIKVDENFKKQLKLENEKLYYNAINSKEKLYAWKLVDVKEIDGPYVNGKLSLWEMNYE